MTPHENYLLQMKRLKASLPYMSEKDFCEANGLKYGDDEIAPLFIARKPITQKEVIPTLETHQKIKKPKAEKPIKTRKQVVTLTEAQRKENRTKWMREKREEWKSQGLTTKGNPPKQKGDKPEPTTEEIRAKRLQYAKTWRANNREKHLEYRRELRAKKKLNNDGRCTISL